MGELTWPCWVYVWLSSNPDGVSGHQYRWRSTWTFWGGGWSLGGQGLGRHIGKVQCHTIYIPNQLFSPGEVGNPGQHSVLKITCWKSEPYGTEKQSSFLFYVVEWSVKDLGDPGLNPHSTMEAYS